MNIGIDVDSVLADLTTPVLKILNKIYNKNYKKEEIVTWDFWNNVYNIQHLQIKIIMNEVWKEKIKSGIHKGTHAIKLEEPFISSILTALKKDGHTITIITNRNRETTQDVMEWLDEQAIPYDNFIQNEGAIPKLDYPISILCDDSPIEVLKRKGYTLKYFLLRTQPWNKDIEINSEENIIRIDSLSEIGELIKYDKI